jgi:hypothetical protein
MSLDPIRLDDISWAEMVIATRRRIAAVSGGEWTLHAPVDPGITLLELFAYMLEQRAYWMDHAPDSVVRGAMRLLGEQPRPTEAAGTVMHFSAVSEPLELGADSIFTLSKSTPPLIFSAKGDIVLLPFQQLNNQREQIRVLIDGVDRSADLEHGKVLRLFRSDGHSAEVRIELWLKAALPKTEKRLSLLFDLLNPTSVPSQWSPEAVKAVPPPAKISWFYFDATDKRVPFADSEIDDGTGGLRRSGVVTLSINESWKDIPDELAKETYKYKIDLVVDKSTFSAPPLLKRLIPNVAVAYHQHNTEEQTLKRDWLPLAGNEIALVDLPEDNPVKNYPPIENTISLQLRERDGEWHEWQATADLAFHGPTDRVFVADRVLGKISFGDGLTGRLPVLMNDGGSQIVINYTVGGGEAGNLGANLLWNYKLPEGLNESRADATFCVLNVVETTGGAEPETISALRERAASSLKARTRAVIREDYEEIARTVPGIAIKRAYAAVGFHPSYPCVPIPGAVTVFILPDVPRPDKLDDDFDESLTESAFVPAPIPDAGALAMVQQALEQRRLAGSEVIVLPPSYIDVAITIEIESNANNKAELRSRIDRRLRRFFDPLIGGDEEIGWPFGEPVRPSVVLRETQRELGNQGTVLKIFVELPAGNRPNLYIQSRANVVSGECSMLQKDSSSPFESCGAIALGSREEAILRLKSPKSIYDAPMIAEPACEDVPIGPHSLVKLAPISFHFHHASENQGGLR